MKPLSEQQLETLVFTARLDYEGTITSRLQQVGSDKRTLQAVSDRLCATDITAAVCIALGNGLVHLSKLDQGRLEEFIRIMVQQPLRSNQLSFVDVLKAVYSCSLNEMCASAEVVADALKYDPGTITRNLGNIRKALHFDFNQAQLGTLAYACVTLAAPSTSKSGCSGITF